MWPASPARKRRPKRKGSATKLRSVAMLFSIEGPMTSFCAASGGRRRRELGPKALVGPFVGLLGERDLEVVAAARAAPLAAEREAALVADVDQLVRHRGRVRQHAEPAERIVLFKKLYCCRRHARAAHAVEAVAAGDEVALDFLGGIEADAGLGGIEILEANVKRLVHGPRAGGLARLHQIPSDLGLAVDRDRLACHRMQVDAVAAAGEGQVEPLVQHALGVQPRCHAGAIEQLYRALLQHAGADAAQHVFLRALLENDGVDARAVRQLAEEKARGTRADDGDLARAPRDCLLQSRRGWKTPGRTQFFSPTSAAAPSFIKRPATRWRTERSRAAST